MWNRGYILNGRHTNAECVERTNGRFAAWAWTPDADFDTLQTVFEGDLASDVSSNLSSKRGGLTGTLETLSARGRCSNSIALTVSDRDNGVVEGGVNVGDAFRHDLSDLLTSTLTSSLLGIITSHNYPLLLKRHTGLAWALTGASVSTGALATAWEAAAVTHATIRTEVDQTLDRQLDFTTEVTFDRELGNTVTNEFEFGVSEILDLLRMFNAARIENSASTSTADAIDGGETDFSMLLRRNINTGDTSHFLPL